jgi:acyl-CoA synthetase (NDP forming)
MHQSKAFLLEPQAISMLAAYGIPYPQHALAKTAQEAARIAQEIGFPVVLKIVSLDAVHKSDMGGVAVNLANSEQVEAAYLQIIERVMKHSPQAVIEGILVVAQAPAGIEIIVGALDDPTFGPTVMFGLGGIFAEVLRDVSFRVAPLERRDAEEMVQEIKGFLMLSGVRGSAPADIAAITNLLMTVSQMVTDNPDIKELDLNPVRVYEKGLLALDARMLVVKEA